MDINIKFQFDCTPRAEDAIKAVCQAVKLAHVAPFFIKERRFRAPEAPTPEAPTPGAPTPEAPAPEAPAPEAGPATEQKPRTRRSKRAAQPTPEAEAAPAPEDPAPEAPTPESPTLKAPTPEAAPAPEAPTPEAPTPEAPTPEAAPVPEARAERPEMSLSEWKEILGMTQQRLQLADGQPNFEHKRDFVSLVRQMSAYYGAQRPSDLTPANLYYCARQVSTITFDGTSFHADPPEITTQQVEENKQAPF